MKNDDKKWYVSLIKNAFGLSFVVDTKKSTGDEALCICYYITLFLCLLSTQLWKQAKWSSIRDIWVKEHISKIKKIHFGNDNFKNNEDTDHFGSNYEMLDYYILKQT